MNSVEQQRLVERYMAVRERFQKTVRRAGRQEDAVTLIAVSKFHDAEHVRAVAGAGHRVFGESYVQEGLAKQEALQDLSLEWHHIGRVQTNKAKDVAGCFALIHAVDSLKLAQTLARRLAGRLDGAGVQPVLVQVNVGREPQKAGVFPEALDALVEALLGLPHLSLQGLMCLPPQFDAGEESRPFFAMLREVRDALITRTGLELPCLSMGMSGDFEEAIAEGATLVRIGTDIFGPRTRVA